MANGGLQLWSNCHTTLTWTIDANHALYIALPQNGHLARQLAIVQHLSWTLDLNNRRQSCTGHMRSGLGDKSICTLWEFPQSPNSAKTLQTYSLNKTLHITNPTATAGDGHHEHEKLYIANQAMPAALGNKSMRTLPECPHKCNYQTNLHSQFDSKYCASQI